MTKNLSIIMYHYVRPIADSSYPNIKGLEVDGFKRQLDYFQENNSIVSAEDVIDASYKSKKLPTNPVWLTFDDGYKEHIDYVLPELKKRGLQGSFFPPVKPIIKGSLLDVNAIHFILDVVTDEKMLISSLKEECLNHGISKKKYNNLMDSMNKKYRYDSKSVTFFKRLLQRDLPLEIRNSILSKLFKKFTKITSENDCCKELYMSEADIKNLIAEGMYVGSHSYSHCWLNSIDYNSQLKEINLSIEFLEKLGVPTKNWIMNYPYGAYNKDTLKILKELNCAIGITTKPGKVTLGKSDPLQYSRFDTNDYPQ